MRWDLLIIGAGPAGYAAAIRAAELGMSVAIIDNRLLPGGTCLHEGCIPSKSLLHISQLYHEAKQSQSLGLDFRELSCDLRQSQSFKRSAIKQLGEQVQGLFRHHKIQAFHGHGELVDAHHVLVRESKASSNADSNLTSSADLEAFHVSETILEASRILLASGSSPIELSTLPFQAPWVIVSTQALELEEIPKELVIIGSGVIGLELASLYSRLGSKVSLVDLLPSLASTLEPELQRALTHSIQELGVTLYLGHRFLSYKIESGRIAIEIQSIEQGAQQLPIIIYADKVVVAIGRQPAIKSLGIEKLGIAKDPKGRLRVDDDFCTSVESIYAVGDLIAGPMLAHKATVEAQVAVERMASLTSFVHYPSIASVIYTDPEVASVGLSEAQVRAARGECLVGVTQMKYNGRALCTGYGNGIVKLIADVKTKRILGLHLHCHQASELIAIGTLAIQSHWKLEELLRAPLAHPTLSEAIREAAKRASLRSSIV